MESLALAPVHRLTLTGLVGVVSGDSWVPVHLSPVLLVRSSLSSTLTRNKSLALPPRYENKLYFLLWQNQNLCSRGRGVAQAGPGPCLGVPLGLTGARATGAVGAVPHLTRHLGRLTLTSP